MNIYTNDENRWANDVASRIIEVKNRGTFDVDSIIEECESYAKDKGLSEPFRECMAHTAHFLKIACKYSDEKILDCAELSAYGMMYDNWYD